MNNAKNDLSFRERKRLNIQQVGIITKLDDTAASLYAATLSTWLKKRGVLTAQKIHAELDLIIVLGGDGTLLHIAEQAARHAIPVLGINFGTLGFLSDITESEAINALDKILQQEITIENRLMLEVRLHTSSETPPSYYSLNEVAIVKNTLAPILSLHTRADNEFITNYKADGLIFSTPTGSTAYNLSAGGPLVYPGLATITITPLCPFMLSSRPVILPAEKKIITRFDDKSSKHNAQVIVDGKPCGQLRNGEKLEIIPASHPLQLAVTSSRSYFTILRNKLHWGERKKLKN